MDEGGGSADVVAEGCGVLQGGDFRVVALIVKVCAFAEDEVVAVARFPADEDAAHLRIRAGEAGGRTGQVKRALHEVRVAIHETQDSARGC